MDKIIFHLTDETYVNAFNKTNYPTSVIIDYVKSNIPVLKESFLYFIENLIERNDSNDVIVQKFCKNFIKSFEIKKKIKKYEIHPPDKNGFYHPEYLMIDVNKSSWHPEEVNISDYERLWNIYQSPLYKNDNLRFLPNQTVGHRRPYDKPYFPNATELTQDTQNQFINSVKTKEPPIYDDTHSFLILHFNTVMKKYKNNIRKALYDKIMYNRAFINIYEYMELKKTIPDEELVHFDPILDFKQTERLLNPNNSLNFFI